MGSEVELSKVNLSLKVSAASKRPRTYETIEDFEWALGLNKLILGLMGVWPNERHLYEEPASVMLRVPLMIVLVFACIFLPQMYALVLVFEHLPLVIDNLITSCAALTACVKLYFIWRSKRSNTAPPPLIVNSFFFHCTRRSEILR